MTTGGVGTYSCNGRRVNSRFVQDELDAMFEQAIAAVFGEPKPRRRVIKIDPQS